MRKPRILGDFIITKNPGQDEKIFGGISLSEWLKVIRSDTSLEPVDVIWGKNPITAAKIKIVPKGGAKWIGHPSEATLPLFWDNGQIYCQSIDEITLRKVMELAVLLQAECIEVLE